MNVLLVRPMPDAESIGLHSFMICEPLELEYASAYLKARGHKVLVVDMILERRPLSALIADFSPDIVGFTAYITHVGTVKEYAREVKRVRPDCVTVVGGVHAEVVPEDFDDGAIDAVLHANALEAIAAIAETPGRSREVIRSEVPGVWNGPEKKYARNTSFPYPMPDRASTKRYRSQYNYIFHEKCATIKTSFGCAYSCEFCFCVEITGHKYYERDINEVVAELTTIEEENVFIVDDDFLFNKKRVVRFCELVAERGIRKNYILFGRSDFIVGNEGIIKMLKGVGLKAVFVGIESFREKDLTSFKKRTSVEVNERAVRILEENGLACYSGVITGPDWDEADFDNLAKRLNGFAMPIVNIQPLTPMPHTPAFESYKNDFIVPRDRYACWDMAHLVLRPEKMSVRAYYRNIVRTYTRTMVAPRGHRYVLKNFGVGMYLRILRGVTHISLQYLRLMVKGNA